MNISEIHKLTNNEIVDSIARMMGSPMETAMKAELEVRFIQAVTDLSSNVYALRLSLDSISKANKSIKNLLIFIILLLIGFIIIGGLVLFG